MSATSLISTHPVHKFPDIFFPADCRFGQSLVVTAIAEGRQAARQIDLDLMGSTSLAGPGGVIKNSDSRGIIRSD